MNLTHCIQAVIDLGTAVKLSPLDIEGRILWYNTIDGSYFRLGESTENTHQNFN